MSGRYIAFDVETPNYANDRMSAIGLCIVEGGESVNVSADESALLTSRSSVLSPLRT